MILRLACLAMGTRFELALAGEDEVALRAAGEEALLEIEECEQRLSPFRRESMLSHVHRCAAEFPVRLDEDSYELFACSQEIWHESMGAFDPSVAPRDPDRSADATQHAPVGFELVKLDAEARTVRFRQAGLRLDFGAIAKGQALDLAAASLRESGIQTALLHGGTSSSLAIGQPKGAKGFRIALPGGLAATIRDEALALSSTSSPRDALGEPHIIDPRSGRAPHERRHAVVVAPSAMIADAWATALVVRPELHDRLPHDVRFLLNQPESDPTWPPAAEIS